MAKIVIYKNLGGPKLGEGTGPYDKNAGTAAISQWVDKAGLRTQQNYSLTIDGKSFENATCTAVASAPPYATFANID